MKNIICKLFEPIFVVLFIAGMTVLNLWHIIYYFFNRPPGSTFIGISHHYEDYFYYLSQVTQGMTGSWATQNLYTTEPIPSTLLWWTNIILGKIAAIFKLNPWTVYDGGLFVMTALSIYIFYLGAKNLYPTHFLKRLTVLLFASLSTCGYTYVKNQAGESVINPIVYFYNYTSSLNRLGGVVHLMMQNVLSLIVIFVYADILTQIFWGNSQSKKLIGKTIILSLSAFLLSFINPVYIIFDALCMIILTVGTVIIRFNLKKLIKLITVGLIITIPLVIPYILMEQAFKVPFYQYFRWWESSVLRAPVQNFIYSYGPLLILAPIGIIPFLSKISPLRIIGVLWAILPIAIYWTNLPGRFSIPVFRIPQPPSYIILGAFVVEALYLPGMLLAKLTKNPIFLTVIFLALSSIYLIYQIPMINEEVRSRKENYTLMSWLNHINNDLLEGLMVLKSFPHDKNVLAFNNLELLVPAISGQRVYTAHRSLTLEYPRKIAETAVFYTNQLDSFQGKYFLDINHIGWVLWKKADGDPTNFAIGYPFLKIWYENPAIIIYKVEN
jgi:hypothetical protein